MENKTLKEILEMNVKSDEFFEVYKVVSEKYWTFEKPDYWQVAAKTLVMWAERFDADKVILCHKIIEQIMKLDDKNKGPVTGNVVFGNASYFFDIYESDVQKDSFQGMLKKAQSAMRKGDIEVEDQRGKRFFRDKPLNNKA